MDYFSTGVSKGKAFCNRVHERAQLSSNIKHNIHTAVVASRRYGKTSLVQKVIQDEKLPFIKVDYLVVSSVTAAQQILLDSISDFLVKEAPTLQKIKPLMSKFFQAFEPRISMNLDDGISLDLSLKKKSAQHSVIRVLEALDQMAQSKKKRIVIFFDEFQQLMSIEDGKTLEAAIRNVAQQSSSLSFIFSGSQRHVLASMFDDSERPLYRLCHQMVLELIAAEDYSKHIQKAAKGTWKKACSDEVVARIIELSRRHPYCLNALCTRLWSADQPPSLRDVNRAWEAVVEQDRRTVTTEINKLSANQRAVLVYAAWEPYKQPASKLVSSALNLPTSSVVQAHRELVKKDYLQQDAETGTYFIVNPVIWAVLIPYAEQLF